MNTAISPSAPALVFGGARGMGAAIVRRLAAEGRPVAFTYVSSPERADALVKAIGVHGGAGLAVAAVAIPTAIAYPAIAGLPAEIGFYARSCRWSATRCSARLGS